MNKQPKIIKVLIVEDDYLLSDIIEGILEKNGYLVVGKATNGVEATTLAMSLRPHVVVMDLEMPNMGGIEAARQIQKHCPTPIVVLTAHENGEWVNQASEAGVGAYLVKPLNPKALERAITIARARFADMMALRQLNNELEERNKDLDAFAHTVAHDLQDPLSIIIGYTELLNLMWDMPTDYKSYTHAIIKMGHKMTTIIRELTLLSRIRQLDIETESLNMAQIVVEAQQRLTQSHLIEPSQVEIIMPQSWPTVWGHAGWVEEIWVNYMSNAIKYGGQPPRVELGATLLPDGKGIHFWVRDNGQGLTSVEQAQLFKPFTRLHSGSIHGTGLGLSIVNRIIEKLGGQVTVESELGQGSQFGFTLPITRKIIPKPIEFTTTIIR